ncbi:histidine kinase [Polaribacter litorisediminis]|uniref:sensor histidine kinase n=1 Tax=Polaribacter litorisediminis TaxID=1908341 RepID=UPI001CBBE553|nr:histidine kinase [Polaribacter litorisediminis]UAM98174.1 histidine kinase [Polaribacter litorisediminis]
MCFLFCSFVIKAQQPATIHLTEKGGLPDIEFYNIIEDSEKFIWLAADKGLYRYNGREYTYFSHSEQRGNAVFGTLEDHQGRVWCNNIYGQFFYVEENKLQLFIDLSKILNGELSQFKVTAKELLVFTGKKIVAVNLKDKKITLPFNKNNSRLGLALKLDQNYLYTEENKIIQTDHEFTKTDSLYIDIYDTHKIESIARFPNIVSNGKVSFCHFIRYFENVFYQFDLKNKELKKITVPDELKKRSINQVIFKDDDIWIATDLGIQIFSLQDNTLVGKQHFLQDYFITKIIIDSYKNYWITTKGDGIFVMPSIHVFKYDLPENILNINKLKNLGNSTILLGTNKGNIATLHLNTGTSKILDARSAFRVSEIIESQNNNEFIIVKEDAAFSYHKNRKKLKKIDQLIVRGAKSLSKVHGLGYVLSSYKNAVLLDDDFKIMTTLVNKRSYTNYFSEKTNHIYIGTVEGFFVFDEQLQKSEIKYHGNPIAATSITESAGNTLWVSTFKNGIYEIHNNAVVANYNETNGLLSNKTGVLQADEKGLWITTEKGIQFLDFNTRVFQNLTRQNGIPSYRITAIEILENKVLFSSNSGLFGLNKNKVFSASKRKDIYFEDVTVNDIKQPIQPSYNLDYNKNKIRFTFNVNGFQSAINTRYEYRLLGLEPSWHLAKEQINNVNYNSLPSGNYTFQVKIIDEADTLKSIEFSISSPIWKRWWFYLLLVCLLGVVIYAIFTSKIRTLKIKQNEILQKEIVNKQLVLSQLENLRSQMNPHFIFNALNSIQEYIVLNEKELASSFLIKFSRLIRIYLEQSRENEVTLKQELNALHIYLELEKNRFEDILDYTITVSKNIDENKIKVPSLFIQPYVENALKHGLLHKKDNRKLNLIFNLNERQDILFCEIADNGIGVSASKQLNKHRQPIHRSFATSANEKRVKLLNTNRKHKIRVHIEPLNPETKTGTKVLIIIPI